MIYLFWPFPLFLRDKEEMYIRILLEEGTRDSSRNSLCINRIHNVLVPFPYLIDRPSTLQVDTPLQYHIELWSVGRFETTAELCLSLRIERADGYSAVRNML